MTDQPAQVTCACCEAVLNEVRTARASDYTSQERRWQMEILTSHFQSIALACACTPSLAEGPIVAALRAWLSNWIEFRNNIEELGLDDFGKRREQNDIEVYTKTRAKLDGLVAEHATVSREARVAEARLVLLEYTKSTDAPTLFTNVDFDREAERIVASREVGETV